MGLSLVYKPLLLDEVSTQDSNKTVLYDCMHVMYADRIIALLFTMTKH